MEHSRLGCGFLPKNTGGTPVLRKEPQAVAIIRYLGFAGTESGAWGVNAAGSVNSPEEVGLRTLADPAKGSADVPAAPAAAGALATLTPTMTFRPRPGSRSGSASN